MSSDVLPVAAFRLIQTSESLGCGGHGLAGMPYVFMIELRGVQKGVRSL